MKKSLLFFIACLCLTQQAVSQNWFAPDHRWMFHVSGGFAGLNVDLEMVAAADTIIKGHASRKWVFHSNNLFSFPPKYTYSDGPKAYYFDVASDSFVKIYDFSLPVGAEVHVPKDLGFFKYKIEAIDTVQAGTLTLKRQRVNYLLQNGPSGWHFDILENIGMVGTPFDSLDYSDCAFVFIPDYECSSVVDGYDINFLCFSSSNGAFRPGGGGACTLSGAGAPEAADWIAIPNPTDDYLEIVVKNSGQTLRSVTITDVNGQVRCSWAGAQTRYSLATLPSGVYLLQASFGNGYRAVRKISKF